ncbi:N-terminal region of Chorein, a TM vesicle-mediated sorter-domain-containing protein [Dunaliella salina]|uniref:N-terminal region of Chorein, a TM vesicle-mediated sorter-domain-containing protein n=1 Tax=Dunaliella salina TaxID=3046 RepID=A0ABQ7G7I2_DUNSA|nr:N-terminal region of Chorein, a TM vesicle-mediated sorter-domain-containing protein [Dunaliella salina]|eukprot:KAF5830559.1 N-terminal region of Chorein, a TM vesicle-mediated sorter-domain-containing protein [Dunaliella salina]
MFEGQVAFYLNKYLGKYLNGLDAESLRISVWKGDVELRNLTLKPEALQDLDLPCTVKAGLLGRLTLKVPWARLGQEPVVAEFDRLYILAEPHQEDEGTKGKDVAEYVARLAEAELEHKRKKVAAAESKWLKDMEAKAQQQLQQQQQMEGGEAAVQPQGRGGWGMGSLHRLIDSILGNLQLVLTNVHIRYEDDGWAWAGHRLAVGVLLGRVAAHTVDEQGKPAFVTTNVLLLLRKAVTLSQLGAYFDVDRPHMEVQSWAGLSLSDWDRLFSPALHLEQQQHRSGGGMDSLYSHDYLINPVSGSCNYTRRSSKFRQLDGSGGRPALPKHETSLRLQNLAVALSGSQYVGAQALAEALDTVASRMPHAHLRPRFRPSTGASARAWWQYALRAVSIRYLARSRGSSWSRLHSVCSLRKKYVPHYAKCLSDAASASGGSRAGGVGGDASIAAMDAQLEEATILVFRCSLWRELVGDRWWPCATIGSNEYAGAGWYAGIKIGVVPGWCRANLLVSTCLTAADAMGLFEPTS